MPNLFTKVKDRASAAAQPKPRTTHQVRGQVDTPFLLLTVLLVVVASVAPRRAVVSSFELQRRREKGDTSAADELRRSLLIDDILSLKKAVEALLLVCLVPSAIMAFGWLVGVLVSVLLALGYGRLAHNSTLSALVDQYYMMIEPRLLRFVEHYPKLKALFLLLA